MTLDIVTKGIPFLHMAIVTVMVFAGVPRIFSHTALLWGACAIMSIPHTEEERLVESVSSIWMIFLSMLQSYEKTSEKPNKFELFRVQSKFGEAKVT